MRTITTKTGALAVVALLLTAGLGAASVSVDSSGTDATTSTSQLQDGTTIEMNASDESYVVQGITENGTELAFEVEHNGVRYYRNTSMVDVGAGTEGTHWNGTITEANLKKVPANAGENVTVDVTVYNKSNTSDATTFQVYLNNSEDRAVATVTDAVANDSDAVEFGNVQSVFGLDVSSIPLLSSQTTDVEPVQAERSVSVTENTSQIDVYFRNSSTQDAFSASVPDDPTGVIYTSSVAVDDEFVPIVASSDDLPDYVDEDEDAYAVLEDDGSSMTIENADSLTDGTETFDIVAVGNEQMNAGQVRSMLQNYDASTTTVLIESLTARDFNGDPFEED
jgi:hypothetical protein